MSHLHDRQGEPRRRWGHIIAFKVGCRLEPFESCPARLRTIFIDDEPVPLCIADTYYAENGSSSVFEERTWLIGRR
ncbi:protein of unknown function [Stenotrophomonas maltophilia]|nr:protein of unknown function [Stenotrophomonas maltophilia]